MLKQARSGLKTNTLHIFLAKQLLGIVKQIRHGEDQLVDYFSIRFEGDQELDRRLWRLATYDRNQDRKGSQDLETPTLRKHKSSYKKRKSIFAFFGDNATQVIFEHPEIESISEENL